MHDPEKYEDPRTGLGSRSVVDRYPVGYAFALLALMVIVAQIVLWAIARLFC